MKGVKDMRKQFAVGENYKSVSDAINMVNINCDIDNEPRIPMKFYHEDLGWFIECLHKEDEPRLDRHLRFIFGLD